MTTRAEKLLVIGLGNASLLHTSSNTREYVRLSATGLVELKKSFLHKHEVSLTPNGIEARRRFTVELLDMLRSQMPAHDEFQRVRNRSKNPCHCGECWAVRENDRVFRQKARRRLDSAMSADAYVWTVLDESARAVAIEEGRVPCPVCGGAGTCMLCDDNGMVPVSQEERSP